MADMDELEHAKKTKKVVKMSTFWDDPPSCENSQLFFSNEYFPKLFIFVSYLLFEISQRSSDNNENKT